MWARKGNRHRLWPFDPISRQATPSQSNCWGPGFQTRDLTPSTRTRSSFSHTHLPEHASRARCRSLNYSVWWFVFGSSFSDRPRQGWG
ncbi:hypothetical protein N658DRAFT_48137 [Parathielavia hyrcaniae]|uniref:Uncharacterized protein n=1 Tax=Parathielavia hyrcaniae TaxID=113614 RepID=A0AAN6T2E2_9PEZI|nr:hypothetical protein N658DRAFT_48137 [Parathielavia hyrcaniae]